MDDIDTKKKLCENQEPPPSSPSLPFVGLQAQSREKARRGGRNTQAWRKEPKKGEGNTHTGEREHTGAGVGNHTARGGGHTQGQMKETHKGRSTLTVPQQFFAVAVDHSVDCTE